MKLAEEITDVDADTTAEEEEEKVSLLYKKGASALFL